MRSIFYRGHIPPAKDRGIETLFSMPQYELMYLLGSQTADDEVPKISQAILKFAEDFGATEIKEAQLGKKKLAYPIGKTRNGHYVVVNFTMDGKNINTFDAKIRTQDQSIIRYLIVNLDEHLARMAKDKIVQSKIVRKGPPKAVAAPSAKKEAPVLVEINQEELDKKIEEALSEDLTK
jgi:small subunit ribosomal protein S6